MIDIFSNQVALIMFVAGVIFLIIQQFMTEKNSYSFQIKQYEWLIAYAETEGNEEERKKNEYLKDQFVSEYATITKWYLIISSVIAFFLLCYLVSLLITLPTSNQITQSDDNTICTSQNATYNVNNYFYSFHQNTAKQKPQFSIKELMFLKQKRDCRLNLSFSRTYS